jgi:glutaredoxin-related protein
MIKVYGSKMCPDCRNCELNFKTYGVEYEYYDINESLRNLKTFLIYRDTEPVFDRLKAINDIGIPACIDESGKVFTDWEGMIREMGHEVLSEDGPAAPACSLSNRKGC